MKLNYVGVDLAKNVFQLHGIDRHGQVVWRRRLRRGQWLKVLLETVESGCVIGMEACTGAHHWARTLQAKGFAVRLIAPQFVKPYVKSNKNDRNDAISIALDFGVCSSVLARSTDSWPDMDCGADLRLSSNDRY